MSNIPQLEEMLKAGVHFGHRTSRWHPKMAPYIHGVKSGLHVIDVEKTQDALESILQNVEGIAQRGGTVLFVGTKAQTTGIVAEYAKQSKMPYVNTRWLGGTFTNFSEIQKRINHYLSLLDKRDKGELKKYTKLEQLQFDREIADLDDKLGGISTMKSLPDAIFVVDVRHDKTAVTEARKRGISVIGIVDTNVNPGLVDHVIPCNDDSVAAVEMITRMISNAVQEGAAKARTEAPKTEKKSK